jgi:hypothetical protein
MADITLSNITFETPQQTETPFPVSVSVENNETVAPVYGAEALCSNGVFAADGHKVDVTVRVRDSSTGQVVQEKTTQVCATVEQPSNVAGDTTAEVTVSVPSEGQYSVEAEGVVPGAGGSDTAQPKTLTVGTPDDGPLPTGEEDTETDGQHVPIFGGLPDDSSLDLPDAPTGEDALGVDPQMVLWVLLAIAALYAFGQGFDVNLGGASSA